MQNSNTKAVLDYVSGYIKTNGFAPTYQEIMDGTGIKSKSTVFRQINNLEADGYIQRVYGSSRAMRVTQ